MTSRLAQQVATEGIFGGKARQFYLEVGIMHHILLVITIYMLMEGATGDVGVQMRPIRPQSHAIGGTSQC